MLANWLFKDVPKFSTILCSAGMMVPWVIPDSAVAHDVTEDAYQETECEYDTIDEAVKTVKDDASYECFYMYDADEVRHHVKGYKCKPSGKYKAKNFAKCVFHHSHGDSGDVEYADAGS